MLLIDMDILVYAKLLSWLTGDLHVVEYWHVQARLQVSKPVQTGVYLFRHGGHGGSGK